LFDAIRRLALAGYKPANAYVGIIRPKLPKIDALINRKGRFVRLPF
jgi:hypothetical protein